jgi:hypothetical protein
MTENEVSERILGCAIRVHRELGPGLLESVYEEALCHELSKTGLEFKRQQEVAVLYRGVQLKTPLVLDVEPSLSGRRSVGGRANPDAAHWATRSASR